jgi:hypothetical protein
MDPETPRKSRLSLRKKKRILELLDAGVQNSYSDLRNLALSSFPLLKVKKYKIAEEYGTFPFLLIVVFFRCQSCLFSFFVSIFMQRNGFGKKKLPRSKVGVYIFGSKVSSETSVIKRPDHF